MKRIFILVMMIATFATAAAQSFNMTVGNENKKVNVAEVDAMKVVGKEGGLTIVATNQYASVLGAFAKKSCVVMALDDDMNIVRMAELPETKDCYVQAATMNDGKVYVLTSNTSRKGTVFERFEVDVATMQTVGAATKIFEYSKERKDANYYWVAQSEDGSLTGLVNITTNRRSDKFEATEMLLDEEMKIEWSRDYPIYSLTNLMVTEEGQLVTIGVGGNKDEKENRVYVSVIDETNAMDMRGTTKTVVEGVRLASFKNGKALAIGYGINPEDKREIRYMGIMADTKTQEIKVNVRSLTEEERCVFGNLNLGKSPKKLNSDFFLLDHCQATEYGAVGTLQQRWSVERCDNKGNCSITSYGMGIVVFAIDNDGEFVWHHAIRSNLIQGGYPMLVKNALCVDGGDVYFMQTENPKWPATYDISKSVSKQKTNGGSKAIGIYHIGANGAIEKSVKTLDQKAVLSRTMYKIDDTYIGFTAQARGARMVKIKN